MRSRFQSLADTIVDAIVKEVGSPIARKEAISRIQSIHIDAQGKIGVLFDSSYEDCESLASMSSCNTYTVAGLRRVAKLLDFTSTKDYYEK